MGNWAVSMLLALVMLVYDALDLEADAERGASNGRSKEWITDEDIGRALLLPVLAAVAVSLGTLGLRRRSLPLLGAYCAVDALAAALSLTWAVIWSVAQTWAIHTWLGFLRAAVHGTGAGLGFLALREIHAGDGESSFGAPPPPGFRQSGPGASATLNACAGSGHAVDLADAATKSSQAASSLCSQHVSDDVVEDPISCRHMGDPAIASKVSAGAEPGPCNSSTSALRPTSGGVSARLLKSVAAIGETLSCTDGVRVGGVRAIAQAAVWAATGRSHPTAGASTCAGLDHNPAFLVV